MKSPRSRVLIGSAIVVVVASVLQYSSRDFTGESIDALSFAVVCGCGAAIGYVWSRIFFGPWTSWFAAMACAAYVSGEFFSRKGVSPTLITGSGMLIVVGLYAALGWLDTQDGSILHRLVRRFRRTPDDSPLRAKS